MRAGNAIERNIDRRQSLQELCLRTGAKVLGGFFCIVILIALPIGAFAYEIEGFRLGMSIEQVKRMAAEKHYSFKDASGDNDGNWKSYLMMKDGPSISLCGETLSAVGKTYTSNLHEFTDLVSKWTKSLGNPETNTTQLYAEGVQFSSIEFKWAGGDNVRRTISLYQNGSNDLQISYGFSYIDQPCRPH